MEYNKKCGKMIVTTGDHYSHVGMPLGMSLGMVFVIAITQSTDKMIYGMLFGMVLGQLIGAAIPVKMENTEDDILWHLKPTKESLDEYLISTKYIDSDQESILCKAKELQRKALEDETLWKKNVNRDFFNLLCQHLSQTNYDNEELRKELKGQYEETYKNKLSSKEINATYEAWNQYQKNTVKQCYEFVRDEIGHSLDEKSDVITTVASQVLQEKTGICHAKANLLAALCRALQIPAGICYQHLAWGNDDSKGYCLHAFNAVYVCDEWLMMDARGNKEGVDAQFPSDAIFKLAFAIRESYDEYYVPWIYEDADEETMSKLGTCKNCDEIVAALTI